MSQMHSNSALFVKSELHDIPNSTIWCDLAHSSPRSACIIYEKIIPQSHSYHSILTSPPPVHPKLGASLMNPFTNPAWCINFFGIQPTLTHVPTTFPSSHLISFYLPPNPQLVPYGDGFTKSINVTRFPRSAASWEHAKPADPPPITTRSEWIDSPATKSTFVKFKGTERESYLMMRTVLGLS